jgi:hypothetical protein
MRDYARIRSHLLWDLEPWHRQEELRHLSDDSALNAFAGSLADSFYKKLCPLGNSKLAEDNALKKFKAINDRISTEPFGFEANNEAESCFWDYFIDNFNRTLGFDVGDTNYDLDFIREHMSVGSGAA